MTVSTSSNRTVSYAGDGGSGPFSVPFRVLEPGDLKAAVIAADGARTSLAGFSVSGTGEPSGATVMTEAPIAAGETLVLWTETAAVQPADYLAADAFPAETHEGALDRLTLIAQDARRDIDRAFKVAVGEETPAELSYPAFVADAAAAVGAEALAQVAQAGASQAAEVEATGAAQAALVEAVGGQHVGFVEAAGAVQAGVVEEAGDGQLALIAAANAGQMFAITANALSNGAVALASITAGSGGTNGTFDAVISGGGGSGMAIRFVVGGGAVISAVILNPGVNYSSAPTISLAASAGLTGAAMAVTLGARRTVGQYFNTPGTGGAALNVYRVDSGPAATLVGQLEAWQAKALRYQFGRARHDTAVSAGGRPWIEPYRLRMYMGTLAGGAVKNANGTYTLPAGATWTSPQLTAGVFDVAGNRYAYVPTTTETTGAIEIKISRAGTTIAAGNTTTQPGGPDYYRQTWNNSAPLPYVQIEIKNVSAASVTIYPIEVYTVDASHFPQVLRFDATEAVSDKRPVIDWNMIGPYAKWRRLAQQRDLRALSESRIDVAFDSVNGSDAAAGRPWTPKQNLTAGTALTDGQVLGLKRGSRWNQSVNPMIGSTTKGLAVIDYSAGRVFDGFPILDGGVDVAGLTWTDEGSGTWSATVPCATDTIKLGEQNYSSINVIEVTLAEQATKPRGCQRIFEPVNVILSGNVPAADQTTAINTVKATAGKSLGVFTTGNSTLKVYIHTRDGLSPAAGTTYGYRVSNLGSCMDWIQGNTRQAVVSGVEFRQGADGLGIFCGSNQSMVSRVIAMHGWKHTFHIEGGEARDIIIYNRGSGAGANAGNCYVSPTADGHAWRWTYGMSFYCNSGIYSHAAAGSYTQGEISYWWFIHERDTPTGSLCLGSPGSTDQCTRSEEMWTYAQGYIDDGRAGTSIVPCNTRRHHNLVRKMGRGVSRTLTEHNIYQLENIGGVSPADRSTRGMQLKEGHVVRNNLIHITAISTDVADYNTQAIEIIPTGNNNPNFNRNIVILDNRLGTSSTWVAESASGLTWASDYNLIILCVPGSFASLKFGGSTKVTIEDYLTNFPGRDANSLFLDLRDDPRGARAIFMDPTNGDYRWAQTPEAARAKAYCEANDVGPEWITESFPAIPTVDEAADALMGA